MGDKLTPMWAIQISLRAVLATVVALGSFSAAAVPPPAGPRTAMDVGLEKVEALMKARKFTEVEVIYEAARAAHAREKDGIYLHEWFYMLLGSTLDPAGERDHEARTEAWFAQSKHPAAAIAHARALMQVAKTLDKAKDWAGADARVAKAYGVLVTIRERARQDSNWHGTLLMVARLQGWETARVQAAVRVAVQADPYPLHQYISAASALAASGRGDPQMLAWLADLGARSTQKTEGQSMYARIYLEGGVGWFPNVRVHPFARGHMEWKRLNAGMEDWRARYREAPSNLDGKHAALACIAGDRKVARSLLEKMGPTPPRSEFEAWGGRALYDKCKAWVEEGRTTPKTAT
jgi:hypothetical protein